MNGANLINVNVSKSIKMSLQCRISHLVSKNAY